MNVADAANFSRYGSSGSDLVGQFWAFYAELAATKRRLSSRTRAPVPFEPESSGVAGLDAAHAVRRHLIGVLELLGVQAQRAGARYALDIYHEAQYVMAAVADEQLLNFAWPGRDVWTTCLVEESRFGTRVAGDRFFERLEDLLRTRDPARRDLALIYLIALALGFEGKYRGSDCASRLQAYRSALYAFSAGREPDPMDRGRQITPQAYGFTVGDAIPQQVPNVGRWVTVFVFVLVALLGVSYLVWEWRTAPLIEAIRGARS